MGVRVGLGVGVGLFDGVGVGVGFGEGERAKFDEAASDRRRRNIRRDIQSERERRSEAARKFLMTSFTYISINRYI